MLQFRFLSKRLTQKNVIRNKKVKAKCKSLEFNLEVLMMEGNSCKKLEKFNQLCDLSSLISISEEYNNYLRNDQLC